jgi:hypothetical protein
MNIWATCQPGGGPELLYICSYPRVRPEAVAPIGDVSPMNVAPYIHQWHVTNEYILNSLVPTITLGYICQQYICRRVHRLTDEFYVYSLV